METTKRIVTYSFNRRGVVLTLIEFTLRSDISRKGTPLSIIKWWDCNVTVLKPLVRFSWFIFEFSTVYLLYLYGFLRWWQGLLIRYMLFDEKFGLQWRKAREGFRKWVVCVGAWRKNNCKFLGVCGGIYNSKTSVRRVQRAEFYSHYLRQSNMIERVEVYICSSFCVFALLRLQEYHPPWLPWLLCNTHCLF